MLDSKSRYQTVLIILLFSYLSSGCQQQQFSKPATSTKLVCADLPLTITRFLKSVYAISMTPDGRSIFSTNADGSIKTWQLPNGTFDRSWDAHKSLIYGMAISADNRYLVSGSDDKTVKVWDRSTGKLIHQLNGHQNTVYGISISADSKMIASGSFDPVKKQGIIRLWFAASEEDITRQRSK